MVTREWLQATRVVDKYGLTKLRKAIECADGFSMSVQASAEYRCTPRDDVGPYSAVEIGFPSERVEALMKWAEDPNYPTGTIYGWVPVEVVDAVIAAHGGMKDAALIEARE